MVKLHPVILLQVSLCLLINQPAAKAEDLHKLRWTNSLASIDQLDVFLASNDRMAKETLSLNKGGLEVILGPSIKGDLTLSYCLRKIKRMQKKIGHQKGLVLVVPTIEVFKVAEEELRRSQCANWITLLFHAFKGPNGNDTTISSWKIMDILNEKILHTMRFCVGFTIGYNDKGYIGYSHSQLFDMLYEWSQEQYKPVEDFDFSLDIYHLSHSDYQDWDILDLTKQAKRIEFFTNEAMQDKVNISMFRGFMDRMQYNISNCYFNVPEKFLHAYFGAEVDEEVVDAGFGLWVANRVIIGMALVVTGVLWFC